MDKDPGMPVQIIEHLKDIVQLHRVCWEVLPEQVPVEDGNPLQVGFNLMLYGAHAHDADRFPPGCPACQAIYRDLRQLADWIVPKDERPTRYEIDVFDQAIRYDPMRGNRPDVTVTIRILHRSQREAPVDVCEVFCLHEMEQKLVQIGAQCLRWTGE